MVQVAEEQQIEIFQYFQLANFLFASTGSSKEFLEVQEVGIRQKLHKRIVDIDGSTHQAAHDQPYPFSATQTIT